MDVNEVLTNIDERRKRTAALTDIERPIVLDTGLLTAWDPDSIVMPKAGEQRETYFRNLARDNVQVVLNKLYSMEGLSDGILELPEATNPIPRAQSYTVKPPTKWQQFAERKGIKYGSKHKEKKVWDAETKRWVPRYGYEKEKNEREKNWVVELKN